MAARTSQDLPWAKPSPAAARAALGLAVLLLAASAAGAGPVTSDAWPAAAPADWPGQGLEAAFPLGPDAPGPDSVPEGAGNPPGPPSMPGPAPTTRGGCMPVSVAAVAVTDRACVAIPLAGHPIATHPPAPPDGLAQPPREVPPQPANATLPTEGTAPAPDEVTEYEGFQALDLEADPAAETVPSAPDSDRGCGDPCPSPLRPAPDAGPAPLRTAEAAPPPAAAALVGAVVAGSLLLWWWLAALLARPARRLHPRAEDLLQAVCAEPGLSFRALRDATGLANGVALHHLRRLLREGRIVSRRHRNTVRFFENHGRYAGTWREATVLRDPLNRRLHEWLAGNRGATQADTVQASRTWGWQRGVTQKRLALLEEAGLLARSRHGRSVRYLAIRPALPTPAATDAAAWTSQPTSAVAKV